MKFIITGLPRSRTAWIANYLTYGNMFCVHEATRNGIEGLEKYENVADVVGMADTGAVLIQDKLIEKYPDAKWTVIDRPCDQVLQSGKKLGYIPDNQLFDVDAKLGELKAKVQPLVIKYEELDGSIQGLAQFVNPDWTQPKERHEMLTGLNVQIRRDALAPINGKLAEQKEPASFSPNNHAYRDLIKQICGDNINAYVWMEQLVEVALTWDHLIDGDAVHYTMADRAFKSMLTEWPLNPFFTVNAPSLLPVLSHAISDWQYSYMDGAQKDSAYSIYADVPSAIAYILGGQARVDKYMPQLRKTVHLLKLEDDKRDGERK